MFQVKHDLIHSILQLMRQYRNFGIVLPQMVIWGLFSNKR